MRDRQHWDVHFVDEVRAWHLGLPVAMRKRVSKAVDLLVENGPALGRPTVDTVNGSVLPNLKELRLGTVRISFCFDPWRSSVLLVGGDKAKKWNSWYVDAIPLAEQRYHRYLINRNEEEADRP